MKNVDCARMALMAHALKPTEDFTPEEVSALITDLAHYAEHKGYNLQEIIRIAALNYEAERTSQQSPEASGESSDSQAT